MRVSAALLALGSATSAFAALSLTTPSSINQCQDATFQISGNQGHVMLSVVPSVDPCAHDALLELGPFNPSDGPFTWHNVNITSGTSVFIVVDDESNAEAWSQVITIGGGGTSCASSSSSSSSATRTTAHVDSVATGTTGNRSTNTNAPANAGSPTGTTSGAVSISGSPQIGIAALLAGAAVAFFV